MATPALSYQNKFTTTLSGGIAASDTTIPLTALPTPVEGYLILEPDSSVSWEEIYYTSKTGSAVICPSVGAGRGIGGSTAASHNAGATVRMDSSAELFSTLQDATALTGVHQMNIDNQFDHVVSGCVWTADSAGSTLLASMTSGVVYINGRRHTVSSVSNRTFTASKDTYIDLLYSTINNIATVVYTEVSNNGVSPALAANSVRIGIIVTGASNIATGASVNQGQEDRVLPIASSIPYSVTDSLGNLICPRDPNRKILGFKQRTTNKTSAVGGGVYDDVAELTASVIVPTGRKVKITAYARSLAVSGGVPDDVAIAIRESTTVLSISLATPAVANYWVSAQAIYIGTPTAGAHTFKASVLQSVSGPNLSLAADPTYPAFILVELI